MVKNWSSAKERFKKYNLEKSKDKEVAKNEIKNLNEFFEDIDYTPPKNFRTVLKNYDELMQKYRKKNGKKYDELDQDRKYKAFRQCVIFARDDYKCKYCSIDFFQNLNFDKKTRHLEIDHIHGKPGETKDNLNTSCFFCNHAKMDTKKDDFDIWLNHIKKTSKK